MCLRVSGTVTPRRLRCAQLRAAAPSCRPATRGRPTVRAADLRGWFEALPSQGDVPALSNGRSHAPWRRAGPGTRCRAPCGANLGLTAALAFDPASRISARGRRAGLGRRPAKDAAARVGHSTAPVRQPSFPNDRLAPELAGAADAGASGSPDASRDPREVASAWTVRPRERRRTGGNQSRATRGQDGFAGRQVVGRLADGLASRTQRDERKSHIFRATCGEHRITH